MRYIVQVGAERVEVEVDGDAVTVDGVVGHVTLRDVPGTPVRLVTMGDAVHRVIARRQPQRGRYLLSIDGFRYEVEALDERTRAIRDLSAQSGQAAGPATLVAPMPGMIVRLAAVPGDIVQAGQGLVVMEAMKMENELRAPAAGTVARVLVEPGMAVEKGAVLVEIDNL